MDEQGRPSLVSAAGEGAHVVPPEIEWPPETSDGGVFDQERGEVERDAE